MAADEKRVPEAGEEKEEENLVGAANAEPKPPLLVVEVDPNGLAAAVLVGAKRGGGLAALLGAKAEGKESLLAPAAGVAEAKRDCWPGFRPPGRLA